MDNINDAITIILSNTFNCLIVATLLRRIQSKANNKDESILPLNLILDNKIDEVNLNGIKLSNKQVVMLASAMKKNVSVKKLHMNESDITDEGVLALSEMLKVNNTLIELKLNGNNITDNGAEYLINALKVNNVLCRLFLSNNYSFSSNMAYRLYNQIRQYKQKGTNGFQQVKNMWINSY